MGKSSTHTKYYTPDGQLVPGVTTVKDVMAKPFLLVWANKLGLAGIEIGKYVDNLADVGTLAHLYVESYYTKKEVDVRDFSPNQVELAQNSFKKFLGWEQKNKLEVIGAELKLVSSTLYFGGTCDLYGILNGKKTLIDIKTSKEVYPEHFTQVAGYKLLLEENGYPVEDAKILRIGRDESEGFDEKEVPMIDVHAERFLACLKLYQINNKLKVNKL